MLDSRLLGAYRRGRVSHVNRQSLEPFSLATNQLCIAQTIRIILYTRLDYGAVETSAVGLYGSSSARGGFIWLSPASWALTLSLGLFFPLSGRWSILYSFGSIYRNIEYMLSFEFVCDVLLPPGCHWPAATF